MLNFDMKTARAAWTVSAIPILACAIYLLRKTLLIFVVALMFSYLLYPLVDALQRRLPGKSRATALILPFLLVIFVVAGFVVFIGKPVGSEAAALAAQMKSPDFSRHVREWEPMNLPVGEQIGEHYSQLLGMVPEFSKKIAAASKNLVDMLIIPILGSSFSKTGARFIAACSESSLPAGNW